ncbi:MAG: PTS-dependent dihydroxyacetone kinase phosphotransferase subunit DhaM [Schwartzia sp.]|nr:PTS-dependent dihydroxyacetone kinase phosphotransferase subunit DhaM [Schwartzia sp. (in: firmicutes)]
MVGMVIVSHSSKIAEGVCDLALQMASDYEKMIPAGGLEDGSLGTDPMRILDALRSANDGDGVAVLVDLGSGIMSAETAIELLDGEFPARIADAPLVEGAVVAVIEASTGASLEEVIQAAESARGEEKL